MRFLFLSLALAAAACQASSPHAVVPADPAVRTPLLEAVAALEGRWVGGPEGSPTGVTEFFVSSGGSAVREVMLPGTEMEMTNMYTLDGNGLVMTHYCAAGNQPHMRATSIEGGRVVFESIGVSDLKSTDEYYMGAMTIVFIDEDNIEQRWVSYMNGERDDENGIVFALKRER